MWQNSKVKFIGVTDGTSNTVVMASASSTRTWRAEAGRAIWAGHTGYYCSSDPTRVRGPDQRQ